MDELIKTVSMFLWFMDQSVFVGGFGIFWFLIPFLCLFGVMVWQFPKIRMLRGRAVWLILLPLVWIGVGVWGAYFWLDWQNAVEPNPDWVFWPIEAALPITVLLIFLSILWLKGARLFVTAYAAVNLYFAFAMSALASMAASGAWL